ncbi:MAG: hypothetical protein KatS3mg015_1251 [Fimbriimonadales bacterium]|nr:MAG: hypothetical protein KatS3mg015_1251 [Fimbriimonadales bacterium]
MEVMNSILENFVVQIFLGIGGMILLISIGEAIRNRVTHKARRRSKEEAQVIAMLQKEVAELRKQVEELRTLALDHSMSLDRNVEILQQRLDGLEQRVNQQQMG